MTTHDDDGQAAPAQERTPWPRWSDTDLEYSRFDRLSPVRQAEIRSAMFTQRQTSASQGLVFQQTVSVLRWSPPPIAPLILADGLDLPFGLDDEPVAEGADTTLRLRAYPADHPAAWAVEQILWTVYSIDLQCGCSFITPPVAGIERLGWIVLAIECGRAVGIARVFSGRPVALFHGVTDGRDLIRTQCSIEVLDTDAVARTVISWIWVAPHHRGRDVAARLGRAGAALPGGDPAEAALALPLSRRGLAAIRRKVGPRFDAVAWRCAAIIRPADEAHRLPPADRCDEAGDLDDHLVETFGGLAVMLEAD